MIIDITPIVNIFFNLLGFGIGLDFVWCGYWFLKKNDITRLPKLLGYMMFKLLEVGNKKSKSKNDFVRNMFSMKTGAIGALLVGFEMMASSMFALLSQLPK